MLQEWKRKHAVLGQCRMPNKQYYILGSHELHMPTVQKMKSGKLPLELLPKVIFSNIFTKDLFQHFRK